MERNWKSRAGFGLNLSYMMSEATVDYILDSVVALAKQAEKLAEHYVVDASTARFRMAAE